MSRAQLGEIYSMANFKYQHIVLKPLSVSSLQTSLAAKRMVRCDEGIVYFMTPRHPTDIGLQLGKACYPWSRKGQRGIFLFLLFLPFHFYFYSCFFPVPLFHLLYYLFCLFFSARWHKMNHKGWHVITQHKQWAAKNGIFPIAKFNLNL